MATRTMTEFPYEAEVRLLRWGESSSAGRTITLELPPDEGQAHPFKGLPTGQAHGQRFIMQFVAIGDDEQPIQTQALPQRPSPRSEAARAKYKSASDMERARTRAALLPKDARFILWVEDQRGYAPDEGGAEHYIRDTCCAGESRKLIAEDEMCYRAFIAMETDYLLSIGALPEVR
jgi:hypothetical protein